MSGKLPEQLIFGLDIGTRSVVGTVGYRHGRNSFNVVAQATRFHETRAMMDGQIHDIGKVAETIGEVRRELEKKTERKLTDVCIAAAGRVLRTYTVTTDYSLGDELTVTEEMIRTMELTGVEQAHAGLREEEGSKTGFFCVGYSVIRYYMDGIQILNLEGHKASHIGADILATFLPQDVIDGLYTATGRAGLNVVNLTLEPIAAINLAIPEQFRLLNLALVDVGAGTSDICITKDGSVTAYGMIPCAGDFLTEAIMRRFLVEFKTAEAMKLQLSGKKKKIKFTDIIGLTKTVPTEEVTAAIMEPMKDLTRQISQKIKELNGGKNVSAIFIVGGGGKHPEFTSLLAADSKLPEERVALRGEEVLQAVSFEDENIVRDPMLVTPIGICLNYYEQNNNFIFVKANGELVKLYDNGKLTVLDAALGIGIPSEDMFPKRGKPLSFTINGQTRRIRGEAGESAVITINGKPASISSTVIRNDEIEIRESTAGEPASATINDLNETKNEICFVVNGKKISCPRLILCNDRIVSEYYEIEDNDDIRVLDYYTIDKLTEYMDVERTGNCFVNNIAALGDEKIYENFTVEFGIHDDSYDEPLTDAEEGSGSDNAGGSIPDVLKAPLETGRSDDGITVNVNGSLVRLKGKSEYRLVDVLDFYPFDTRNTHGEKVVMRINGAESDFSSKIAPGASIEMFWE